MPWNIEDTHGRKAAIIATFVVVINHEGQYSIWPDYLKIPRGWTATGKQGNKQECLEYVDTHWTDMRPASLRRASGV